MVSDYFNTKKSIDFWFDDYYLNGDDFMWDKEDERWKTIYRSRE